MMALSDSQQRGYPPEVTGEDIPTANDRFKKSYGSRFWSAFIIATLLHMAVFALWPELATKDFSVSARELEFIELPPEIEIPPPPEAIVRPQTPVMATTDVDPDITIGVTNIDAYEPDELPPPPDLRESQEGSSLGVFFTPMTVRPGIRNRGEVQRALEREYPPLLRDAGIGGTVLVWFYIDDAGGIERTQIHTSSGHRALDEAALRVAEVIDFTPALNRERRVPVWISLPISFQVR
jgi:TonB family protein